jgi:hypothetical protein
VTPPSRPKRITILESRLEYLVAKREKRRAACEPVGWLTDEITALRWALPVLRAELARTPDLHRAPGSRPRDAVPLRERG